MQLEGYNNTVQDEDYLTPPNNPPATLLNLLPSSQPPLLGGFRPVSLVWLGPLLATSLSPVHY